jgi:phosphoglycerate-specific signal transduction histidine kinase
MYENRQVRNVGNSSLRFEINLRLTTLENDGDLCQRQDVITDLYGVMIETIGTLGICNSVAIQVLSDNKGDVLIRLLDRGSGLSGISFDQLFTPFYRSINETIGFRVPAHTRMVVLPGGKVKVDLQLNIDSMTALCLPILCSQKLAG